MTALFQDFRNAIRLLERSPGFAVLAVLTLATGIAASVTIFGAVHAVLLKPLPYAAPDRLVRLFDSSESEPKWPMAPGNFHEYRSRARSFEGMAAYERADLQIGGERPEQLRGMRVTPGFFPVLGWQPAHGRDFTREEGLPEHGDVAILSNGLWRRRFAADRSIVGRTILLSDRPFLVAGVMPEGFNHVGSTYRSYGHGNTVDVWWVRTLRPVPRPQDRNQHYLNVVGRVRPDVTIEQAQQELDGIAERLRREYPASNTAWGVRLSPLREEIVGDTEPMLLVLLAAVQLVLLLACVNVAGLLLGRTTIRAREIAVRAAVGATRLWIVRQLLVESLVVAVVAGAVGVILSFVLARLLPTVAPASTPRLDAIAINWQVVLYAAAAAGVTALLFGLAPAIQLARRSVVDTLKRGGRTEAGSGPRLRSVLVVAEIALAFVLVVGSGLLVRSFEKLTEADPGFDARGVLTTRISLPASRYPEPAAATAFFTRVRDRLAATPSVAEVGIGSDLPWTGYDENTSFGITGRTFPPQQGPEARFHMVTPGYFRALGVPLLAGRDLSDGDVPGRPLVVLINERLARRFWEDHASAVGARLNLWGEERTVAGVVGDVGDTPWAEAAEPALYFPQAQQYFGQDMLLVVRASADPLSLTAPVASALKEIDPALPLADVRTLSSVASAALETRRFLMWLVGAFGATALLLAAVGVYGVAAQNVGGREREFGLRQALGATASDILRSVLSGSMLLGATEVAAGVALAWALTRVLTSVLYGVHPLDPLTFTVAGAVLLAIAVCGAWVPARRATRFDPAAALRLE